MTIFGVGGFVVEYGLGALLGLIAGCGVVLSLLIWILGEVKPWRSFLIGGLFIVYRIRVVVLIVAANA